MKIRNREILVPQFCHILSERYASNFPFLLFIPKVQFAFQYQALNFSPAMSKGMLKVEGSSIVDADGNSVLLRGVCIILT